MFIFLWPKHGRQTFSTLSLLWSGPRTEIGLPWLISLTTELENSVQYVNHSHLNDLLFDEGKTLKGRSKILGRDGPFQNKEIQWNWDQSDWTRLLIWNPKNAWNFSKTSKGGHNIKYKDDIFPDMTPHIVTIETFFGAQTKNKLTWIEKDPLQHHLATSLPKQRTGKINNQRNHCRTFRSMISL